MNLHEMFGRACEDEPPKPDPADEAEGGKVLWLGDMARLELKPGDVVVLMHPLRLSHEAKRRLAEQLSAELNGIKCLVLEEGMKLGILGPDVCAQTEDGREKSA